MVNIKNCAEELDIKLKEYHDKNQPIPQKPLYHYTSFLGLSGILQSKNLWLTDHKFLNDPSEIEHGKHIILNQINNHINKNKKLCDFMKFFFDDIMTRGYKTFVTSFCKEGDYLPAWRYYGNNGAGFSIGFRKNYFTPLESTDKKTATSLYKVEYAENSSNQVKEIFGIADNALNSWTSQKTTAIEPFLNILIASLITIVPSMKHPDYNTEQEWRLCLPRIYFESENRWEPYEFPTDQLIIDKIDHQQIPPFLKTIKSDIPRLTSNKFGYCDIETIYVGPRLDFITAKTALEKMLLDNGISDSELKGISIKKSERPYQ